MSATTTATATATSSSEIQRNPKDSMKMTWLDGDKSQWTRPHKVLADTGVLPTADQRKTIPVHAKTDKMPYLSSLESHKYILANAVLPLIIDQAYYWIFGSKMHVLAAFALYLVAFKSSATSEVKMLRDLGFKYGYLDGDKHERDGIPDHAVGKVVNSIMFIGSIRPLMCVFFAWSATQTPLEISWLAPIEIGVYQIVIDFWFYWYHRAMHANDSLWKYHRTHHLTKHPNPLLASYADHEQEFMDIMGVPALAYGTMRLMGFPLGFYELWLCHLYIVYTEIFGHSGLRLFSAPPSPFEWFLTKFHLALAIEDHDLHHRTGWKKSHNYGKQTLIWDRLFGTVKERIEGTDDNIDYSEQISLWPYLQYLNPAAAR